jgi:hypothetical protein
MRRFILKATSSFATKNIDILRHLIDLERVCDAFLELRIIVESDMERIYQRTREML